MRRLPLLLSVSILALSACQRPAPPDPEKPPEPKALTQAVTQPLDQARDAKQALDEAAHREGQAAADAIGEPAKTNTP